MISVVASGCGGGQRLPAPLLKFIDSSSKDSHVTGKTAEVYGPSSRRALVQADSGDLVGETAAERSGCYLIVYRGHFEQGFSAGSSGAKPHHYTIETIVWTPDASGTDVGLEHRLSAAVSRLGRLTLVALR